MTDLNRWAHDRRVQVVVALVVALYAAGVVAGIVNPRRVGNANAGAPAAAGRATVARSGSGMQATDKFQLAGDYRLDWTATPATPVGCYQGMSLLPGHSVIVSETLRSAAQQSGTTHLHGLADGDYWFDVSSGCAWSVTLSPE